jgi:hypothetical protein
MRFGSKLTGQLLHNATFKDVAFTDDRFTDARAPLLIVYFLTQQLQLLN